ncbi:MAG: hypothetical protein U0235_28370 [Polyangiaceae bacterium]
MELGAVDLRRLEVFAEHFGEVILSKLREARSDQRALRLPLGERREKGSERRIDRHDAHAVP